ncbi:hypothetical protein AB4Z46_21690 [Variovorax sp. M-6]|uniref:hypothetical protein n=1 Tax=Variovorax sp. M-6 TaxID=3233041 RepID=UPI003F9E08AD
MLAARSVLSSGSGRHVSLCSATASPKRRFSVSKSPRFDAHPKPPETEPLGEFMTMWDEIEKVKLDGAAERLERIASDLALLKDKDHAEYLQLRDALRRALKQTD